MWFRTPITSDTFIGSKDSRTFDFVLFSLFYPHVFILSASGGRDIQEDDGLDLLILDNKRKERIQWSKLHWIPLFLLTDQPSSHLRLFISNTHRAISMPAATAVSSSIETSQSPVWGGAST